MHAKNLIISWIFTLLFSSVLFAGDAQTFSENGVQITVEKDTDSIKGYKAFKITAQNTSGADRSLNAKILLQNNNAKMPKGGSGSCTVFLGLPAGSTKTEVKQCKETSDSNSWVFEIVKVYTFLPK
jgi:hypothetical protein